MTSVPHRMQQKMLPLLWQPLSTVAVILLVMLMARWAGRDEGAELGGLLPRGRGGGFSRAQLVFGLRSKRMDN